MAFAGTELTQVTSSSTLTGVCVVFDNRYILQTAHYDKPTLFAVMDTSSGVSARYSGLNGTYYGWLAANSTDCFVASTHPVNTPIGVVIDRVDMSTTSVTKLATIGATSSPFPEPRGMCVTDAVMWLLLERYNVVRRIAFASMTPPHDISSTYDLFALPAGHTPKQLALHGGRMFVGSNMGGGCTITEINPTTGATIATTTSTVGLGAGLVPAYWSDRLWFGTSSGSSPLLSLNLTSGGTSLVAASPGAAPTVGRLAGVLDGVAYASTGSNKITAYNLVTGQFYEDYPITNRGGRNGIAIVGGKIWIPSNVSR